MFLERASDHPELIAFSSRGPHGKVVCPPTSAPSVLYAQQDNLWLQDWMDSAQERHSISQHFWHYCSLIHDLSSVEEIWHMQIEKGLIWTHTIMLCSGYTGKYHCASLKHCPVVNLIKLSSQTIKRFLLGVHWVLDANLGESGINF